MNFLVLNLTRFGDLLQTQATIADLAREGHSVGIVCLENFSGAAALLSGVSHIAPLPGSSLLAALARDGNGTQKKSPFWGKAVADLAAWKEELCRDFPFDIVCNLTPTISARLLTRFLGGDKPFKGYTVDAQGFAVDSSSWASFLYGTAISRGVSPFNVVDIFRMTAQGSAKGGANLHAGQADLLPPPEALLQAARETLQASVPLSNECKGYVALQLGASEERRRWPIASFVALGERLWREEKLCPVLLGSKQEIQLAERYAQAAQHPHSVLTGKTNLEELAAILCNVRLLITNDTGTMHFAAGLGTPVLAVFLATAQPFDTGAYREGSCSVEAALACHPCSFGVACPHKEACREAISVDCLAGLALSFLRTGEWSQGTTKNDGRVHAAERIWLSVCGEDGFIFLRSLSGHACDDRTIWMEWQRICIRQFLDRDTAQLFTAIPWVPERGLSAAKQKELAQHLSEARGYTELLLQQGKILQMRPSTVAQERFLATWNKVHVSLKKSPFFSALGVLWLQETHAEGLQMESILLVVESFAGLLALFEGLNASTQEIGALASNLHLKTHNCKICP